MNVNKRRKRKQLAMAMANETGSVQHRTAIQAIQVAWNVVFGGASKRWPVQVHLDWGHGPKRVIVS